MTRENARILHTPFIAMLGARQDLYAFLDVGQLAERPCPINNTKIYGGDAVNWTVARNRGRSSLENHSAG